MSVVVSSLQQLYRYLQLYNTRSHTIVTLLQFKQFLSLLLLAVDIIFLLLQLGQSPSNTSLKMFL